MLLGGAYMKKVLVANRGEIASRIIKTCKDMGILTVAVYSKADAELPYVNEADQSIEIGEAPVQKSYLNVEKIIEVAKKEQVDAIHPGYGFLSENASFSRRVREEGMSFIGPSPEIIELMGEKIRARMVMKEAGIPVVPGSDEGVGDVEEAVALAEQIGYPVMLKASSGGGGIGMQKCEDEPSLRKAYQSNKGRAKAYFGNDELFIEKFIEDARHIEVQVFGDQYGNIVHLFERECSIQRRNQKVIEEAPSPSLSSQAREAISNAAVKAAEYVKYTNAGTVEFVVDNEENFYFLEMNTRLQVEHPVTEGITGLDLVKWQLLVSNGEVLPLAQDEIRQQGHCIEFRLYAEDPIRFLPSPGKITEFTYVKDDTIRLDAGYAEGSTVTPFYDPMIAKVIVSGSTRDNAINTSVHFFQSLNLQGIKHNGPLFSTILKDSDFRAGKYSTNFLKGKKV
jgi:acetyl-CoA carboxylase, biotin carboxylase subunit